MPSLLQQVASSAGDTVYTESRTPGGRRISQHATDPQVFQMIRSRDWDYIVIQCQSQEPSFPDGQVASDVLPYAKILCDSIRANSTCTIPLFFMTWGRKNGDASNCDFFPPLCTYEGMDSVLSSNYLKMGSLNSAEVCGVGAVWHRLRQQSSDMELYSPDESHPSYAGSIAGAYAFYTSIFRKSPLEATFNGSLTADQADSIRSVVKYVVFDHLEEYNIGINDPDASVFLLENDGCQFSFNGPERYESYAWDFGDGNVSEEANPIHTYSTDGKYTVTFTLGDECGRYDSSSREVQCGVNSVGDLTRDKLSIYPNPNEGRITINSNAILVSIVTLEGKSLPYTKKGQFYVLDTDMRGVVIVGLQLGEAIVYRRIMME